MPLEKEYEQLRTYLMSIAYNMTGIWQEAEDIVQDSFRDVILADRSGISNIKSYLTRIVINKCIDRIEQLKKKKESYIGTWLPEPVVDDISAASTDILPYAFMVMCEVLNPMERAILILREGFSYSYDELAAICEISEQNARQLLHRAKEKIRKKQEKPVETEKSKELLHAFLQACINERPMELSELLKEDIRLYSDGGGKAVAALNTLAGTDTVTRFFVGISRKDPDLIGSAKLVSINGAPGLLFFKKGVPDLIAFFDILDRKIDQIFLIRNPEKFSRVNLSQNIAMTDII